MGNLGGGEIIAILLLALIVLGPSRLPEAARQAGKAMAEFRRISSGFQRELRDAIDEPMNEVKSGFSEPMQEMKRTFTGPVEEVRKAVADPFSAKNTTIGPPKEKSAGGPETYRAPAERSDDEPAAEPSAEADSAAVIEPDLEPPAEI